MNNTGIIFITEMQQTAAKALSFLGVSNFGMMLRWGLGAVFVLKFKFSLIFISGSNIKISWIDLNNYSQRILIKQNNNLIHSSSSSTFHRVHFFIIGSGAARKLPLYVHGRNIKIMEDGNWSIIYSYIYILWGSRSSSDSIWDNWFWC